MVKSLVTKTIQEQLIEKKYSADRVKLANSVACHIFNGYSDLGELYLQLIKNFTNPQDVALQQGRISQSVSTLVDEGYIKLDKGKYIFTEKGELSFKQ